MYNPNKSRKYLKEIMWRNNFVDTVKGATWYDVQSISLGRWAIGYNFAYVLVRVLDSLKPTSIIELGLGQSTKIIDSFCRNNDVVDRYDIVEQNDEWINFFGLENIKATCAHIYGRHIVESSYKGEKVYVYDSFADIVREKKYSLISIDGPCSQGENKFSRIDILEYIPLCLEQDFCILIDDFDRKGEKNMASCLEEKLKHENVEYCTGKYSGEKDVYVIASIGNRFLTTL